MDIHVANENRKSVSCLWNAPLEVWCSAMLFSLFDIGWGRLGIQITICHRCARIESNWLVRCAGQCVLLFYLVPNLYVPYMWCVCIVAYIKYWGTNFCVTSGIYWICFCNLFEGKLLQYRFGISIKSLIPHTCWQHNQKIASGFNFIPAPRSPCVLLNVGRAFRKLFNKSFLIITIADVVRSCRNGIIETA